MKEGEREGGREGVKEREGGELEYDSCHCSARMKGSPDGTTDNTHSVMTTAVYCTHSYPYNKECLSKSYEGLLIPYSYIDQYLPVCTF